MNFGRIIGGVFLLAFASAWCSFVGFVDSLTGGQVVKQMAAAHYPATTGQVTQSEVSPHQGPKGVTYRVTIRYSFEAAGRTWLANRLRYSTNTSPYTDSFTRADKAYQRTGQYPVGTAVTVYYNPKNPQDAVLSPGVTGEDLVIVLFLTPFHIVGLGLLFGSGRLIWRGLRPQMAGGVKIIRDGFRTRVRLPVYTPVMVALIVAGLASFLAAFPLMGFYDGKPPLGLAVGAIVAAYGAGLAAFAVQFRKVAAGLDDLVIDDGAQTLQLPETFGRKTIRTVGFSDIESVTVEVKVSTDSKGGTHCSYEPTLNLRRGDGAGEKLATWGDGQQAQAFATWLREQLRMAR